MKHRGIIAALIAAVFVSALAVAVMAQPGQRRGPGGPDGPGRLGLPGLQQLDLTDAQKEQIKQINESHRAEFERLATQMRELREKVQSEVVNNVLTAEQQTKLKELQTQRGRRGQ